MAFPINKKNAKFQCVKIRLLSINKISNLKCAAPFQVGFISEKLWSIKIQRKIFHISLKLSYWFTILSLSKPFHQFKKKITHQKNKFPSQKREK